MANKAEDMLSPYRVLDLSGETGYLCGKILADLGADVIKIEPPVGDAGRSQGPFYKDDPDPQKSLFWFAYNNNKRGITLNLETSDGREIFKKLAKTADVVVETFAPGYLDKLQLGYADLDKIKPGIILVSITPFGQSGPWKDYKAPDIVAWALGGQMYSWGDADRPPIRISHHSHAHLHAAADAAVGALMAILHREMTGVGQQINATIEGSSAHAASVGAITDAWYLQKKITRRGGAMQDNPNVRVREVFPCKDGYVAVRWVTGPSAKRFQQPLVDLIENEGMATDFLKQLNFDTLDLRTATQDTVDQMEAPIAKYYLAHTKAELYQEALKRGFQLFPISTTKDILESEQLATRGFWVKLKHPELGTSINYPGAFAKSSVAPIRIRRRPPLIGEHNQEIYGGELGITREELVILKQAKVI